MYKKVSDGFRNRNQAYRNVSYRVALRIRHAEMYQTDARLKSDVRRHIRRSHIRSQTYRGVSDRFIIEVNRTEICQTETYSESIIQRYVNQEHIQNQTYRDLSGWKHNWVQKYRDNNRQSLSRIEVQKYNG